MSGGGWSTWCRPGLFSIQRFGASTFLRIKLLSFRVWPSCLLPLCYCKQVFLLSITSSFHYICFPLHPLFISPLFIFWEMNEVALWLYGFFLNLGIQGTYVNFWLHFLFYFVDWNGFHLWHFFVLLNWISLEPEMLRRLLIRYLKLYKWLTLWIQKALRERYASCKMISQKMLSGICIQRFGHIYW